MMRASCARNPVEWQVGELESVRGLYFVLDEHTGSECYRLVNGILIAGDRA